MLFNTIEFLVFFIIITFLYYILPKKTRYIFLLIVSYFFYMCWNPKYIILLFFSTFVTYLGALLLEKCKVIYKKWILTSCICLNIGLLFYFKYFSWIVDEIQIVLQYLGVQITEKHFNILLPVGISFYVFQALGYLIDVYRKDIDAEHNFLRYALFVSFFPQLVAGPIERAGNLLRQINSVPEKAKPEFQSIVNGITLMLWGLFMKMVIADRVAILVDNVFSNYTSYGSIELIMGAVGFAIQIYCDFGGYSLVAIGAARVLGFSLMENFNSPYMADSIQDFWRRWHISLSIWLKDYIYIPLGGSRCSQKRHYFNLMVTFLVSGIWHGASMTYIFWGGIHGIYQIIGRITKKGREKLNTLQKQDCFSYKLGKIIVNFCLVDLAWIFFKATSFTQAVHYIKRLITQWDLWVLFDGTLYKLGLNVMEWHILIVSVLLLVCVDILKYFKNITIDAFLEKQNLWFRWFVLLLLIFSILVVGEYGTTFNSEQFIYFQF